MFGRQEAAETRPKLLRCPGYAKPEVEEAGVGQVLEAGGRPTAKRPEEPGAASRDTMRP